MKLVPFLLLIAAYFLTSCISANRIIQQSDEVFSAQTERFDLTVAGDTAALRNYLHPALLYIHSNGLEESLQGHLDNVGAGKIDYQSFTPLQKTQLKQAGKHAFVDGLVAVTGLYEGYEFTVNLRYTAIYSKVGKQWQLLRWQSTKIEEN